jgi:hypothetical protein
VTEEERAEVSQRILEELDQEHARRMAKSQPREDAPDPMSREVEDREAEIARLRVEIRDQFFAEHGYIRYRDSRGAEIWLTPDEHAKRLKRRSRRRDDEGTPGSGDTARRAALFLGVLVLAVVVGLVLGAR